MKIENWFEELIFGKPHGIPEFDKTREMMDEQHKAYMEGRLYTEDYFKELNAKNVSASDPMRVIIEPQVLNVDSINDLVGVQQIKKFEFRPQSWDQFIGQQQAKDRVKTITAQFKRGMKCHIILSAIRGHGKTSYIELLAKTLDVHLIQRIGNAVKIDTLPEIINEINRTEQQSMLFIDEIDTCSKEMIKLLNPVIESFQISGKRIRPFLFACATINKHMLYKNNPDFIDRIQHAINFNRYSIEELTTIINQVYEQLYREENISTETIRVLAENCKFNPRTAINLLEFFVVDQNISNVLKTCCIVKDGLTLTDVRILDFLATSPKPVGANAVAMKCGMSQKEFENEWEPFLYEFGYTDRRPSRVITDKGREFLASLSTISTE